MDVRTFYRLSVWLPIAIPAIAVLVVHGFGVRQTGTGLDEILQILLASLLWGGLPYLLIALWGTFWIRSRPECEIRRQASRTPLWTIATFGAEAVWLAVRSGQVVMPSVVFVMGLIAILGLGYLSVAMVFGLRELFYGHPLIAAEARGPGAGLLKSAR